MGEVKKKTRRRRRRKPTPPAEVIQAAPGEPVILQRTFPPGTKVATAVGGQPARPVACNSCKGSDVKRIGQRLPAVYYQCHTCVDPNTMDWLVFKVIRPD